MKRIYRRNPDYHRRLLITNIKSVERKVLKTTVRDVKAITNEYINHLIIILNLGFSFSHTVPRLNDVNY